MIQLFITEKQIVITYQPGQSSKKRVTLADFYVVTTYYSELELLPNGSSASHFDILALHNYTWVIMNFQMLLFGLTLTS